MNFSFATLVTVHSGGFTRANTRAQQLTLPFSPLGGDAVAPAEVRSFTFTKLGGALGVTERREK